MSPIDYSEEDSMLQSMDQYSESGHEGDDYDKSIAKGGVTTPFPWKLHDMLDEMAEKGEHSVVTWQPHGRAFMVHQPKEFVNEIMPHYFNQTKVSQRMTPGPPVYCCVDVPKDPDAVSSTLFPTTVCFVSTPTEPIRLFSAKPRPGQGSLLRKSVALCPERVETTNPDHHPFFFLCSTWRLSEVSEDCAAT